MVWRKRRRYRLGKLVPTYLCSFLGIMVIIGNVIMLRDGFVQLYMTIFGGRTAKSRHELRVSMTRESRYYQHLPEVDLPRVELPSSALAAELALRRLMEEENNLGYKGGPGLVNNRKQSHMSDLSRNEIKFMHDRQVVPGRPPHGVPIVSVSSRDLRQALYVTSDCVGLQNITNISAIGSGWTKAVYRAIYKDRFVALKTVDLSGHDLVTCAEKNKDRTLQQCYEGAAQKLMKEILLLRGLHNPHIVQDLAHCVPDIPFNGRPNSMVTMATELGESIDIIRLLHTSWEDRLRISYGLCKLVHYLAHSPYGSLVLSDYRRQQFVLIDGDLKLTDLDDIGFTEPFCLLDTDCEHYYSSTDVTLKTECIASQCLGMNEKTNIFNTARHFTSFLLPHGAPRPLRPALDQLVDQFSNATKTARELLEDITTIIDDYSTGVYLNQTDRHKTSYKPVEASDLPGRYDYSCGCCVVGSVCTVSVYDQLEAEEICDADPQCKAFVLNDRRSWTGRMLAHFKNGLGTITRNPLTALYIKPTRYP